MEPPAPSPSAVAQVTAASTTDDARKSDTQNGVKVTQVPSRTYEDFRVCVPVSHQDPDARSSIIASSSAISKIKRVLHCFKNGEVEAETVNGIRFILPQSRIHDYENGPEALQVYTNRASRAGPKARRSKSNYATLGNLSYLDGGAHSAGSARSTPDLSDLEVSAKALLKKRSRSSASRSKAGSVSLTSTSTNHRQMSVDQHESSDGCKTGEISSSDDRSLKYRKGLLNIDPNKRKQRTSDGLFFIPVDSEDSSSADEMPLKYRKVRLSTRAGRGASNASTDLSDSLDEFEMERSYSENKGNSTNRVGVGARRARRTTSRRLLANRKADSVQSDDSDTPADGGRPKQTAKRTASALTENGLKVKRKFAPANPHSSFVARHLTYCAACSKPADTSEGNALVYCQGCSFSFHEQCATLNKKNHVVRVTPRLWVLQCRLCISDSKSEKDAWTNICYECGTPGLNTTKLLTYIPRAIHPPLATPDTPDGTPPPGEETIYNADLFDAGRLLLRCLKCQRGIHFDHLDPEAQTPDFFCPLCRKYTKNIHSLLAWRPKSYNEEEKAAVYLNDIPGYKREYLVKFEADSYFHLHWLPGDWTLGSVSGPKLSFFHKNHPIAEFDESKIISEEKKIIDSVLEVNYKGGKHFRQMGFRSENAALSAIDQVENVHSKYKGLEYTETYWDSPPKPSDIVYYEAFQKAYNKHINGFYVEPPTNVNSRITAARSIPFKNLEFKKQPPFIANGKLMPNQLEGLNWLYYKWHQSHNAILADDMGVGKTVQIISFFLALFKKHRVWPFLVAVPQATVPNWIRELEKWAPELRAVALYGGKEIRRVQKDYEVNVTHNPNALNCHVLVTSFSSVLSEVGFLSKFRWQALVVDEAQRLKSDKNQIYDSLLRLNVGHKVLLTGTPLQNNVRELFNLLQFLNPTEFDADDMERKYADLDEGGVNEIRDILKSYVLRRTREEVFRELLPEKAEIIVPVRMVPLQRRLARSLLERNSSLLKAIANDAKIGSTSLKHVFLSLRKCMCHPYILDRNIEEATNDSKESFARLTSASGKLELLSKMLPKLIEKDHRVLIFSQFLDMLTILEDFLYGLEIKYVRMDGTMSAQDQQRQIDLFNAEGSEMSVFLLSTRAGGVGINLATADTVIIYDPDFNPHQDLQALSRAHRFGQKNKVLVFNLVTRGSVEEKIYEAGRKKMALDHLLIDKIALETDEKIDTQAILKAGARALFDPIDEEKEKSLVYDDAAIERLLDRAQADADSNESESDEKESNPFGYARVWDTGADDLVDAPDALLAAAEDAANDDSDLWEKVLKEREQRAAEDRQLQMEHLGRGMRRVALFGSYNQDEGPVEAESAKQGSGSEFENAGSPASSDFSDAVADPEDFQSVGVVPVIGSASTSATAPTSSPAPSSAPTSAPAPTEADTQAQAAWKQERQQAHTLALARAKAHARVKAKAEARGGAKAVPDPAVVQMYAQALAQQALALDTMLNVLPPEQQAQIRQNLTPHQQAQFQRALVRAEQALTPAQRAEIEQMRVGLQKFQHSLNPASRGHVQQLLFKTKFFERGVSRADLSETQALTRALSGLSSQLLAGTWPAHNSPSLSQGGNPLSGSSSSDPIAAVMSASASAQNFVDAQAPVQAQAQAYPQAQVQVSSNTQGQAQAIKFAPVYTQSRYQALTQPRVSIPAPANTQAHSQAQSQTQFHAQSQGPARAPISAPADTQAQVLAHAQQTHTQAQASAQALAQTQAEPATASSSSKESTASVTKTAPAPSDRQRYVTATQTVESYMALRDRTWEMLNRSMGEYAYRQPFLCDGTHATHAPGECPMREIVPEVCPLCDRVHFQAACPRLMDIRELMHILELVENSPEDQKVKGPVLQLLRILYAHLSKSLHELVANPASAK